MKIVSLYEHNGPVIFFFFDKLKRFYYIEVSTCLANNTLKLRTCLAERKHCFFFSFKSALGQVFNVTVYFSVCDDVYGLEKYFCRKE